MNVEVYIDGHRMDVNSDTKISETKQINDFFEIQDRQASYSNTFQLPQTPMNIRILNMLGVIGSTSLRPYRLAKIDVRRKGIPTISGGLATVKKTDQKSFSVYAYNGIIDLFSKIGDKKISELDFSDLGEITLNENTWIDALQNDWSNGFTYPLADYGVIDTNEININYQVPALFIKYLWNKIFSETGFSYEYTGTDYDVFSSIEFQEMAITVGKGPYKRDDQNENQELILEMEKENQISLEAETVDFFGNSYYVQELPQDTVQYLNLNQISDLKNLNTASGSGQFNKTRLKIPESAFYKIAFSGFVFNEQTSDLKLAIERNGIDLDSINDSFSEGNSEVDFSKIVFLEENDEIQFRFEADPKDYHITYNFNLNLSISTNNENFVISFNTLLDSISQKDLIKDVMHHFGLIQQRKGKTYQFLRIEELLTDYENAEDWSDKFDSRLSEEYKVGKYAQKNYMRYKYIDDNEDFADALIKVDDQTIDKKTNIIERVFNAPTNSIYRVDNKLLRKATFYEKSFNDDGTIKEVKPKKQKPFLIRIKKNAGRFNYKIDGSETTQTFEGNYPLATFSNLGMNEVSAQNYTAFANLINPGKKNTSKLFLSVIDVYNLDFLKLKYIKQLGGLFYLNKLQGFTGDKLTKAELISVRTIVNQGEYSDDYNRDYNI